MGEPRSCRPAKHGRTRATDESSEGPAGQPGAGPAGAQATPVDTGSTVPRYAVAQERVKPVACGQPLARAVSRLVACGGHRGSPRPTPPPQHTMVTHPRVPGQTASGLVSALVRGSDEPSPECSRTKSGDMHNLWTKVWIEGPAARPKAARRDWHPFGHHDPSTTLVMKTHAVDEQGGAGHSRPGWGRPA